MKKMKIYKEDGEKIEDNNIGGELKDKWQPVYQLGVNNIEAVWNEQDTLRRPREEPNSEP